jgi:hypothetical protein
MSKLPYEERLQRLGWTTLEDRRKRGDMIFAFQYLRGNVHVNLSWRWAKPLSQLDGPASSVRGNKHARLEPGVVTNELRANTIGVRLATPLNSLPANIMSATCVNDFKNAYDAHVSKR